MNNDPNNAIERYPLRSLVTVLRKFQPPEGPFDPAGAWEQVYGVYTLAGRAVGARHVGSLRLRRSVGAGNAVTLDVRYDKMLTGGRQLMTGRLHGRGGDRLAAADRWEFKVHLLDAAGEVLPQTRISMSAVRKDGSIVIKDPGRTKTLPVKGPCTVNWSLFDAIQRLPGEKTQPLKFTLIDHFDQPKGGCTVSFRKAMDVTVAGGKAIRTLTYDQLGEGNVPWVYWVGPKGRLLFVVAGLEGYALESSKQG